MSSLYTQSIANVIFSADNVLRQRVANAEKDKRCPLPSERIDGNTEDKPVGQLRVRKEVKCTSRRMTLEKRCHVNPAFHPILLWSS